MITINDLRNKMAAINSQIPFLRGGHPYRATYDALCLAVEHCTPGAYALIEEQIDRLSHKVAESMRRKQSREDSND